MTADTAARDVDVAALRKLEQAANQHEWFASFVAGANHEIRTWCQRPAIASGFTKEDAALIAAARNALPALLDKLDAMEAENADMRRERDEALAAGEAVLEVCGKHRTIFTEQCQKFQESVLGLCDNNQAAWEQKKAEQTRADALAAQLAEAEKRNAVLVEEAAQIAETKCEEPLWDHDHQVSERYGAHVAACIRRAAKALIPAANGETATD